MHIFGKVEIAVHWNPQIVVLVRVNTIFDNNIIIFIYVKVVLQYFQFDNKENDHSNTTDKINLYTLDIF